MLQLGVCATRALWGHDVQYLQAGNAHRLCRTVLRGSRGSSVQSGHEWWLRVYDQRWRPGGWHHGWAPTWVTSGYNFVFTPGRATGVQSSFGNLQLWGPNNGGDPSNTLGATSPDGGNFIGADGAFQVGAITQTITGLVAGQQYSVEFDWAGAQQYSFTGTTTEQWIVSLGSQTQATSIVTDVSHGFTSWTHTTITFTADGSSDVLSFLAAGTPDGEPPFSCLMA
jgi:hypothetical protein